MKWLSVGFCRLIGALALCLASSLAAAPSSWSVARNPHFEIYSQAGSESAQAALRRFEQLRAFFLTEGLRGADLTLAGREPVRVIGFRSEHEYDAFRLRGTADAFYIGTESRDYIVMPALGDKQFSLAAHEYAHLVLRSSKWQLPLWLSEGLAEFFSTLRITDHGCALGGDLPMRTQILHHHALVPPARLIETGPETFALKTRDELSMFYAESWALTDMLISSTEYAPHFGRFIALLNSGRTAQDALPTVYSKPLAAIESDLRGWAMRQTFTPQLLPPLLNPEVAGAAVGLSTNEERLLLAELLMASGELNRATAMYKDLAREIPQDPEVSAALGSIALRQGDRKKARQAWSQALDQGVKDPKLCYQYAVLAGEQGLPQVEIRRALLRAIELQPDLDDARYDLALLSNNTGEYSDAVKQLRAMRAPFGKRAFAYWCALADALTQLDKREEAKGAARQALLHAATADERTEALELEYVAGTDLTVQFAKNANGELRLITTRVPHGTTDFNPFIEPQDHIVREEGTLREVKCGDGKLTGFVVDGRTGPLKLDVPDPAHVLMRNSPAEFTCGSQPPKQIKVEYATVTGKDAPEGILRGMEFR